MMRVLFRGRLIVLVAILQCAAPMLAQQGPDDGALYVTPEELPVFVLDVATAFESLTPKERMYAHWMSLASWIGAQITVAQVSKEAPDTFELLLRVAAVDRVKLRKVTTRLGGTDRDLEQFKLYASRFLSNMGNYLAFGDTKFVPRLAPEKFELVIRAAASLAPDGGTRIMELWSAVSSRLYSLNPDERQLGLDGQGVSAYYSESMTKAEIDLVNAFMVDRRISPYNTLVVKDSDGAFEIKTAAIVESRGPTQEWRGASVTVTTGEWATVLADVVRCLDRAQLYAANDHQGLMIRKYIDHFTGGNIDDHKDAMRHWVKDVGPVVETNLGFIESYRDPAGVRGEWEGLVAVVNKAQTEKFAALVAKAPEFIPRLPWGAVFEKETFHKPDFTSLEVLTFANCDIPAGINIPNYDEIRQNEGFKNVSLGNVLTARKPGKDRITFLAESDQEPFRKYMGPAFEVQVGLHELLGHGSGRLLNETAPGTFDFDRKTAVDPLTGKPVTSWYGPGETWNSRFGGLAQTYEECRAEAVGLFLSTEPDILAIFGHVDGAASDLTYVNWLAMARAGVDALRYFEPRTGQWGQAHMQGRYALLNVMLAAPGGLCTLEQKDGEWTVRVDRTKIDSHGKAAVGEFLRKLMVFKATGDLKAGTELYAAATAVKPELLTLRDYVIRKAKPRNVWVQPVTDVNDAGEVILREYPATHDGVIDSNLDRFSFLID